MITFGSWRHRLPGDHRRPGGGRGPPRAPAPLVPRFICCWSRSGERPELAAACPQDMLTGTGSGWCSPIWRRSPTWGCSLAPPSPMCASPWWRGGPTLSTPRGATSGRPPTGRCARASWRRRASCWSRGTTSGWSCPRSRWAGPCPTSSAWAGRPARRRPPGH